MMGVFTCPCAHGSRILWAFRLYTFLGSYLGRVWLFSCPSGRQRGVLELWVLSGPHFGLENFLESRFWCRKKKELWQGFLGVTTLTCHQLDFVALLKASAPDTRRSPAGVNVIQSSKIIALFLIGPAYTLPSLSCMQERMLAWGNSSRVVMDPFPALPRATAFWAVPREIPGVFPGHPTRQK